MRELSSWVVTTFIYLSVLGLTRASPHLLQEETIPQTRDDVDYRLPNNTKPLHYVIKLNPHLIENNYTFSGQIEIYFQALEPTQTLTLHSKELTIAENETVLKQSANSTAVYNVSHSYVTATDFLIITTAEELPVGTYNLTLNFTGTLRDDMIGFYKSSYTNSNNETVWIATSKFEPTHARYAFPCYDEPALKITVDLHLKRTASQHCLANTDISTEVADSSDNKVWTIFNTTPLTSTYLIAFIASDFANISNSDGTFRVFARPSAINTAQYAFDAGILALQSLSNHTGIDYYSTMTKMDQLAIPDFSSGAMENWGLVTYRERNLLFQDGVSTSSDRQSIATVVAHEFAHQWYGNLVSPFWWTYLWLNEGFATYFEYFTAAEVETEWNLKEQFIMEVQSAFAADGLASSHPMNADVNSPTEIRAIFDSISYAKASCVIRMMEYIVTTGVFKTGLTTYLNTNAYSYGTSDLLWEGIQTAVNSAGMNLNVKEIMDTWVTQAGYPVITVTRNYDSNTAVLSQQRFYLTDAALYNTTSYHWWVPINWATASNPDFSNATTSSWIPATDSISISEIGASDWIILNKQVTGFYRVNYDEANWKLITSYLNSGNHPNVHVVNRAQLIDDALNLARAGYLKYSTALDLTTYLSQETDYLPWYSASTAFTYINRLMAASDSYESFKTYFLSLISNAIESVGYEEGDEDAQVQTFLRSNLLNWVCNLGHSDCLTFSKEKIEAWLLNGDDTAISPNLKTVVYCAGIRQSNSTVWYRMWNKFLETDDSTEERRILNGLGCIEDKTILSEYMTLATTSGSGIRSQDSATAFAAVYAGSRNNVEVALDFLINNLESVYNYYGSTSSITTYLSAIGLRTTNSELLAKLQAFAEDRADILGTAASSGIANAQSNLAWIETYEPEVSTWLATRSSASLFFSNILLIAASIYFVQYL